MTKKDYVLLSEVIHKQVKLLDLWTETGISLVDLLAGLAQDLAERLKEENPHFDRVRFLAACGVT